ncbi:carboxypeptidase B [Bombina bombina]|uniref:carboxypeptidase B n=1 Tax=Bombina bombina TaxID=8345 RepID=UPI00235AE031|nr:carboxypeptidase B [Bombina bombina]
MKSKTMKALWISILFSAVSIASSKLTFHGDKVFRIKLQTEEHAAYIQNLAEKIKMDFWHPESADRVVPQIEADIHVNANDSEAIRHLLGQNYIEHEVLFHNLQEAIDAQLDYRMKKKSKKHSYTNYNDWETIANWTCKIVSKFPKIASRLEIGNTYEGRGMYVLKIGNPTAKRAIFVDCGIHAREWISPAYCQWLVKELTSGYSKDYRTKELLKKITFYILPVFNIDGYVYSWTEDRMWRKNRSPNKNGDCIGTDLNRNFNSSWGEIGSSDSPCSEIYCGSSAESERETRNVANFIRSRAESIKAYISFHSYSQMLLYPYGYTYVPPPNAKELKKIAKGAVSELRSLFGTTYKYGSSSKTIYPTSGGSDDWAYDLGIKYSFVFELRDKGKHGFLLPESQITETCTETMLAVRYIADYVLTRL